MLTVHDYLSIRVAHARGESIRSISRRLNHSQKTIRKVLASDGSPPGYVRRRPRDYPKLGPFIAAIDLILEQDKQAPPKQRHTAMRIYQRLCQEHQYAGKYDQVRRYVSQHRIASREIFIPLDHPAGRRCECDFGQIQADFPDGRRVVSVLIVVWSFSHCPFMISLPTQRTEAILHGMAEAFAFFGCVPQELWWDNPKTVAIEILKGRNRRMNAQYAALASHYRFEPLFCMPAKGQEKPDVESGVRGLQRRFGTPVPRVKDEAELNQRLVAFCLGELGRTVGGRQQTIGQDFELEKQAALALPIHRFDACIERAAVVDKYQSIRFDTNRYSVPRIAAFRAVTLKVYVDQVRIVHNGQVIATHRRSYGRDESILDPMHYLATLGRKPACLDHSSVFRNWKLPTVFAELRQMLEQQHGPHTGPRHYIRVLQLLGRHPAQRLERAIRPCIGRRPLTAELIAEKADALTRSQDTAPTESNIECDPSRRVQVPMPDLRRFDQLLNPSYLKGDCDEQPEQPVIEAQPQDLEAADDAGRVRQALT
jgi:transposase